MKIRGNTVGTTMKRPDFNQTNPKKSDYIKNNPIPTITENDEGKIVKVVDGKYALVSMSIPEGEGSTANCTIDVALDTSTFVITVSLKDSEGNVVSQDNVDLPLESVVVGGDEKGGIVTLTLQNGNTITFDIGDLVDGLVSQAKHDEDIAAVNARIDEALGAYVTDIDTLIGEGE